jgi:hypothetical protein
MVLARRSWLTSGVAPGKAEPERRALRLIEVRPDASSVAIDDRGAQRQAQAHPLGLIRDERRKPSVPERCVDARPGVGDGDGNLIASHGGGHYQPARWSVVLKHRLSSVHDNARWLFDNPERANGMNLEVAIEQVDYHQLAAAFEKVTGHPARYIDTALDTYWSGPLRMAADLPAGYNADLNDKSTMSFRDNFTGFWNIWKHEVIRRDYALLDEIHPNRIKTIEDWLRREDQLGRELGKGSLWERVQPENQLKQPPLLKLTEDKRKGRL